MVHRQVKSARIARTDVSARQQIRKAPSQTPMWLVNKSPARHSRSGVERLTRVYDSEGGLVLWDGSPLGRLDGVAALGRGQVSYSCHINQPWHPRLFYGCDFRLEPSLTSNPGPETISRPARRSDAMADTQSQEKRIHSFRTISQPGPPDGSPSRGLPWSDYNPGWRFKFRSDLQEYLEIRRARFNDKVTLDVTHSSPSFCHLDIAPRNIICALASQNLNCATSHSVGLLFRAL